jgi:hypothetical protein
MTDLPEGQPLRLTDSHIELIERLAGFDAGRIFSNANAFNNDKVDYPSFVFAADLRKEHGSSPQRVFQLRAIVHQERDLNLLVDSIRREEPKAAVRVVRLSGDKLRSAVQYDPLDGTPNDQIPISS